MKKEKIIRVSILTAILIGVALGVWGIVIAIKWLILQITCFIEGTNILLIDGLIIIMIILGVIIFLDDIFHFLN